MDYGRKPSFEESNEAIIDICYQNTYYDTRLEEAKFSLA